MVIFGVQLVQDKLREVRGFCQPQIDIKIIVLRAHCDAYGVVRKERVLTAFEKLGLFRYRSLPALFFGVIIKTGQLREETLSRYDDEHQQCQTVPVEPPRVGYVQYFLNGRKKCIQIFRAGSS